MSAYSDALVAEGYESVGASRIHSQSGFESIKYSDGDAEENNLLRILKSAADVSILSPELQLQCVDWVTSYHLSSARANLLRPFEQLLEQSDVVELGAGCGAITRYLGEVAKNVVAVEGSVRRCEINAERLRDLDNVDIVSSELSNFETKSKFDVVVVVGVLEYSGLFIEGSQPHLEFLKKAATLLRPGGKLLLAIENKVGLKYLAGAPEDHVGVPMFGIENRYKEGGVRTFSRSELLALTAAAGFSTTFVHAPVPDYKLTRAVISQEGLDSESFDSSELFAQLTYADPQLPGSPTFNLPAAWQTVGKAKLEKEVTHSFLLECTIHDGGISSLAGKLAFWYGLDRKPGFLKEKVFKSTEVHSKIGVSQRRLLLRTEEGPAASFSQLLEPESQYFSGAPYTEKFSRLFQEENWKMSNLQSEIEIFLQHCKNWAESQGQHWPSSGAWGELLDNNLVDLIPRNAKITENGDFVVFDLEWGDKQKIEVGFLVFRIVNDLIMSTKFQSQWDGSPQRVTCLETIIEIVTRFGIGKDRVDEYMNLELELQNLVSPLERSQESFLKEYDRPLVRLTERDGLVAERDGLVAERDGLVAERDGLVAERDSMLRSKSWRLTWSLRWFADRISK